LKFQLDDLIITADDRYIYVHRAGAKSWDERVVVGNANVGISITEIINDAEQLLD
jgi:hypothetical protein